MSGMKSCKEIVDLLNKDSGLPLMVKMEMRFHLFMCDKCSAYAKHLSLVKDGVKRLFNSVVKADDEVVSRVEKSVLDDLNNKKT